MESGIIRIHRKWTCYSESTSSVVGLICNLMYNDNMTFEVVWFVASFEDNEAWQEVPRCTPVNGNRSKADLSPWIWLSLSDSLRQGSEGGWANTAIASNAMHLGGQIKWCISQIPHSWILQQTMYWPLIHSHHVARYSACRANARIGNQACIYFPGRNSQLVSKAYSELIQHFLL